MSSAWLGSFVSTHTIVGCRPIGKEDAASSIPEVALMPTNRLDEQSRILQWIGEKRSFDTVTISQMFGQGKTTMATVLMTMMSERDLRAEAAKYSHIFSSTLLYIPVEESTCCATCHDVAVS